MEPEAIIDFGVKMKDEDAGSIKEGGDLDMELNVISEKVEDGEDNDCKESPSGDVAALDMSAVAAGAQIEETEEVVKGDSHAEQHDRENEVSEITCAAAFTEEHSGTNDDGAKVTAC